MPGVHPSFVAPRAACPALLGFVTLQARSVRAFINLRARSCRNGLGSAAVASAAAASSIRLRCIEQHHPAIITPSDEQLLVSRQSAHR